MFILFGMTSCSWYEEEEEILYDRTILVYMAAENTLSSYYQDDIHEMLRGVEDIPKNSQLIIYVDDTQLPRIISIKKNKEGEPIQNILHEYDTEQDSGDPETLRQVMKWMVKHRPANSYGLVLWSHGDAWIPTDEAPMQRSICIDNNQNIKYSDKGSKMNITNLAEVLSSFPKLEFILFDACFMQSVEVAHELRYTTKFIIASPAEIPGPGAPYHRIIKPMFGFPFNANKIAEEYFLAYNDEDRDSELQNYGVLLSVIDCNLLESFASITAEMVIKYAAEDSVLTQNDILHYCPRPNTSRPSYYDMNAYMSHLITEESDYTRWKSILDKTICYSATTPWWYSIYSSGKGRESVDLETYSGVSCYVPQKDDTHTELNAKFRTTSWYVSAGWQQLGW